MAGDVPVPILCHAVKTCSDKRITTLRLVPFSNLQFVSALHGEPIME